MTLNLSGSRRGTSRIAFLFLVLFSFLVETEATGSSSEFQETVSVDSGARVIDLGRAEAAKTYSLLINLAEGCPDPATRVAVEFRGGDGFRSRKILHAGDPDVAMHYRPERDGRVDVALSQPADANPPPRNSIQVSVKWSSIALDEAGALAVEAEPNDHWVQANPLRLGRDVYGMADDVDYLTNLQEGKSGLDWFRFRVEGVDPILVYFQLDLLDRDVSANLRVYKLDQATGKPLPFRDGKDPMEIVHDRERERYSKHLSRTFSAGTYYLEVNANHPAYVLRTRVLPVPPYSDPRQAVEAGMHYAINVGDAWFAQVPREGNIYVRSENLHDTAIRCTACHASSFPTEANLAAHRQGYPIRSKDAMQYVMDRIANSITPLYGGDGLYWQRFIAIPLQAQGKQGSILADFEREVSEEASGLLDRFGPFLSASWRNRDSLPADEMNGVVPLDSKFGFAWRDWRVLNELSRRKPQSSYAQDAAKVVQIIGERSSDRRVETLQDRIHRLYAWSLMDRDQFARKIRRETGALLEIQNPDGGWHETEGPGPSAVYTTGQLVDALLESGTSRDHPKIQKAAHYLLSQQQEFGGWFQDSTHENFRTPMRETRYAVMALSRVYPRDGAPLASWGNRDEAPARFPRTDDLVHTLDDLENLWDVTRSERPTYALAISKLMDHPEPLVRASAAACLGRLEVVDSLPALVRGLADPSKIVWRASAWAIRRVGNRGRGIETIKSALQSPDPRVRRGAVRIFAYQFHGMDNRLDLADRLLELTADPDLWTRLQAIRSLRQWFYRTANPDFQKRIIETYLDRMSQPDVPVIRKNLSEGLFIMLDENLGGGVSLQKNLAELPESLRPKILEARKTIERDVLLLPVLGALERGSELQRAAVLQAFDGSFFKGRTYARRPTSMIDVGNDREFGFLYEPPIDVLERTFIALFKARLAADQRRQALSLCHFFELPDRSRNPVLLSLIKEPEPNTSTKSQPTLLNDFSERKVGENGHQQAVPINGRPLSLETFRQRINPLFYQQGPDGHSCASCHATHSVLRIAEPDTTGAIREEDLRMNYASALKVINLEHPESSLLVLKPRSPYGQGEADPGGLTGMTHVGGTRWEQPDHPAVKSILDWIGSNPNHSEE